MKLLRIKITDPKGFRSLAPGFEYHFRSELNTQEDLANSDLEPFVCAGRNGSGKSNLLEALASIFFQLDAQRLQAEYLPPPLQVALRLGIDEEIDPDLNSQPSPEAYELEYISEIPPLDSPDPATKTACVLVTKTPGSTPRLSWSSSPEGVKKPAERTDWKFLLPAFVVGYSSGENEILSLPFLKMRFVQFDEYWDCLKKNQFYPGRPDARLSYLDKEFSQAILLCNLLFQDNITLDPFRVDVGIEALKKFRIILRRSIKVSSADTTPFGDNNPAWDFDSERNLYTLHLLQLVEADEKFQNRLNRGREESLVKYENFDPAVTRLKRCATCWYVDDQTDTLILDYWVNAETRLAFQENFDSALELFQSLQVLLNLNLYSVSDNLKADLYRSSSHYVNETVPVLASDERIMRFKDFYITKKGVSQPLLLKELSDGEHQLLHSLGLCLLFRGTNSLFLLDEPETHFNPDWRAQFISRLRQCLAVSDSSENDTPTSPEMLITTHTPFLISDSKPEKVLVFKKDGSGRVTIDPPGYNTLGASINKITMKTFYKTETVGGIANSMIQSFRKRFDEGEAPGALIDEIDQQLGDSVEKILLIKAILGPGEPQG